MRSESFQKLLAAASKNADKTFQVFCDPNCAMVPINEKTAWAMAAVIQCDLCRLITAYEDCEREGLARLLWLADITSKLLEARNWYTKSGKKLILEISLSKPCGVEPVDKKIQQLITRHHIHRVNKYKEYRNKFSYHYDGNAIEYLQKFSELDAKEFFEILIDFLEFSRNWAQLTRNLIQGKLP